MLAVRIVGGMGNQLFLYALYKYLKSCGKQVKLDLDFYRNQDLTIVDKREYVLEKYFNVGADYLNAAERILIKLIRKAGLYNHIKYRDKGKGYEEEVINVDWKILEGYWPTFLFAERVKKDLLNDLSPKEEYMDKGLIDEIRSCNSVSVHVRRGDFVRLGTDLPGSYYTEAMDYIKGNTEKPVFYCFSDDIEYCRHMFGDTVKYVTGNSEAEDFWGMSICRHNIVANSTFSAWAAWINQNEDKVVVHPGKWHGKESTEVDERIWPEQWVCL